MAGTVNVDAKYSSVNYIGRDQHVHANSVDQTLLKLQPTNMDGSKRPECLTGTRADILNAILSWVHLGPERVFWLYGLAGSGKSAISTTIARSFREHHQRLGAFIFCNRDFAERSEPSNVIRNIAYRLALFDARIGLWIAAAIDSTQSITESSLHYQFENLLIEPLLRLPATEAPIVIVLDALDECGNAESREVLLGLLAKESARLPAFIRILVTSRAEHDIRNAFRNQPHVFAREIDISSEINCEDILTFVRDQMATVRAQAAEPIYGLAPDWPGDEVVYKLAERAGGLFIWASTACRFIRAHNPQKKLDILLRGNVNANPEAALDALYTTALEATDILKDEEFCLDFRAIMGIVLVARYPISYQTIDELLSLDYSSIYTINKLGCVLRWGETEPVRILHPSFADFLQERLRCSNEAFYIDRLLHHSNVALHCIHHLNGVLKKNISNLVLTTIPVEDDIPAATSYASACWIDHVCVTTEALDILADILEQFMFQHLLHWVEVMSIIKKSRMMIALVDHFFLWLQVHLPHRGEMNQLVSDASRFVRTFASQIEEHPLLIYLSALPFTSVDTLLFRKFAEEGSLRILGGYSKSWPILSQILARHKSRISDIAFSPDGMRIASASFDRTVRVWDLSSGVTLLPPLEGHTSGVFAVAFSPDGQQIASGSADKTVRLWSAVSCAHNFLVLEGHTDGIFVVAFSSVGGRVASGSADCTIRVWDISTGSDMFGPLRGHEACVTTLTFMPNGQQLLSGAEDKMVRGWDMITGKIVLLQGHNATVTAILVSSDEKCIATGSEDGTIILWDSDTYQQRLTLDTANRVMNMAFLPGDTHIVYFDYGIRLLDLETGMDLPTSVRLRPSDCIAMAPTGDRFALVYDDTVGIVDASFLNDTILPADEDMVNVNDDAAAADQDLADISTLAFSPDGRLFASISEDDAHIYLWATETGQYARPPLQGHRDTVESVAFSPDSKFMVSSSADTTIIVWDVMLGMEVLLLRGHKNAVISVVFSSDGMQILSGSRDDTVRLWSLSAGAETHPPSPMRGHSNIESVAFCPGGERVISGSSRGDIFCWDISSGVLLFNKQFVNRPNILKSVEFTPNGQFLMVSCRFFMGQAPRVMMFCISDCSPEIDTMPMTVTPDGWIHNFKVVIGKLPSIVSISVYSSSSAAIVFTTLDHPSRPSIMHFPSSELTQNVKLI